MATTRNATVALYVTAKPPSIMYVILLLKSHRASTRKVIITTSVRESDCSS